jgi:SecD/SecF fusion protein
MTRRSLTGIVVLAAVVTAILYLWQPWNPQDEPSLRLGLDLQGGLRVVLQADGPVPDREDLNAARRVIENRVNEFGVAEPLVQTSGDNRIVVELPGLSSEDQDRALDLIGQQAVLHFRLVRPGATDPLTLADLEPPAFTGEILASAQAAFGQFNQPEVLFTIRREYADEFGRFTGNNLGRRMAIVLDDTIISAPVIQGRITTNGQITGAFTLAEASDLALVLRSGSLPIDLMVEEIRAVGPTLGQDSIAAGTRAALIGGAAVIAAILLYYGPLFGGVLTVGLFLIMLFVFSALAGLGAALTLPGLAGLVLTIGAAVDGNVISFERIKEELREGKSLRLAMRGGFGNSLSAIVDANVTTLLAAAALYQYTTGPVRGFAITLAIGIMAAMFVNLVVVPFLLDVLSLRFKKPRIPKGFYASGIKFVKRAPIVMTISGLLAAGALLVVAVKPLNLSTDFTGGTNVLLTVDEGVSVPDVRAAIDQLAIPGLTGASATIQEVIDPTLTGRQISVRVGLTEERDAANLFPSQLASALGGDVLQADFVGPAVGEELRENAIYAVIVAFGLILIYVSWRFWPNWIVAIAAILASVHDVGIVVGFLDLIGAEFGIPVLAAILFVVGYSLNDSIIIADRIRENLRKMRHLSYEEVIDLSVNQTLSRTIVTSGTTLLPVLALLFLGGSVLRDFSITLLVGIAFGTYSSIFILAPLVVWFKKRQSKRRTLRPSPA